MTPPTPKDVAVFDVHIGWPIPAGTYVTEADYLALLRDRDALKAERDANSALADAAIDNATQWEVENVELRAERDKWKGAFEEALTGWKTAQVEVSELRTHLAAAERAFIAARNYINESPCDPDITDKQARLYGEYMLASIAYTALPATDTPARGDEVIQFSQDDDTITVSVMPVSESEAVATLQRKGWTLQGRDLIAPLTEGTPDA